MHTFFCGEYVNMTIIFVCLHCFVRNHVTSVKHGDDISHYMSRRSFKKAPSVDRQPLGHASVPDKLLEPVTGLGTIRL